MAPNSLVGRNEENLRKVVERCEAEKGVKSLMVLADLATDAGCETTANRTLDHFGRWVTSSDKTRRSHKQWHDMATYDAVFDLNVRGVYNLTRLLVPALVAAKGNVVNISSIAVSAVAVGSLPYGMAKAALDHFTRLISLELAPKGVRVNTVSPGITVSTIIPRLMNFTPEQYSGWLKAAARRVPMAAVCEGSDVAYAVLFLASEASRLLTGAVLPVDGGLRFGDLSTYAYEQM